MTGWEIVASLMIIAFFLIALFISLTSKKEPENGDLEHFDHEHGEADAR